MIRRPKDLKNRLFYTPLSLLPKTAVSSNKTVVLASGVISVRDLRKGPGPRMWNPQTL